MSTKRQQRERASGSVARPRATVAQVLEVPALPRDHQQYISTIVAWERDSRNQGAIIRGRVRRVAKTHRG